MTQSRLRINLASLAVTFIVALALAVPAKVSAQVVGATLSGTITDTSGAVLPLAQVSIRNVATGIVTTTATDSSGLYTAPNLLPGNYMVTASAKGFVNAVRSGITLTVGQELVLNVTLKVGGVTQTVTVTGAAQAVQLNSSTISGVVNTTRVLDLPLNGRSWTDLAELQPGVTVSTTEANINSSDRPKRGLGQWVSISGGRPQQNSYLLDGINIDDYANAGPGSVLGGNLGVDAVGEFSIMTTNYSTEYGRSSGGVISAITKSGTNQFHGDAYEFLRNDAFDARNFFDVNTAPFRRNQFGASAGGPIRKDKAFIFGDYEGVRQDLGLSNLDFVPSVAARNGNLCAPPNCSTTTKISVDPQAARFLQAFFPLPNGALQCPFTSCVPGTGDTGIYSFAGSQVTSENFFITRLDQRFSEKDSLFGTYMFDNAPSTQSDEFKNKNVISRTRRQVVALEETHIVGPALVNTLRLGFNREFAGSPAGATAINPLAASTSYGFLPGYSAGQLVVPGLTAFTGGLSAATPTLLRWNSWQAYDNVFLTKGIHSLKFGADIERIEFNTYGVDFPGGLYNYNSLSDFLTNQPATSFITTVPFADTPRGQRQTIFGAYIQDDMRWRPNLTINLGLRYEPSSVMTEVQGKLSNLRSPTATKPFLGSPYILNPTERNFEPRAGFAWDPFHNGKTAVRGGFGMFDILPLPYEMGNGVDGAAPFNLDAATSNLSPGSFPTGAFASIGTNPALNVIQYYVLQFNPQRNYVMQWNTSLQRELTPNTTAMIAYVGSRALHLWYQTDNGNFVMPTQTSLGYTWPLPIGSGTTINPVLGRYLMANWSSWSKYNALEFQITKRMSHGFQAEGSYTWSKGIDTSSSSTASDQYKNSLAATYWPDPRTHTGLSDTNVGQDLVANFVWNVPAPASLTGPATWVLHGWQLNGIYTLSGGPPFSVGLGGDPLGQNSVVPFDYPNRLTGPGCNQLTNPGNPNDYIKLQCFAFPNPVNVLGNAGRNIMNGPALSDLDFSIFKNTPVKSISENFNVQFRVEMFNILNRANFEPPFDNNTLMDQFGNPVPGAGAIDATTTTSRQIQFALKVIW